MTERLEEGVRAAAQAHPGRDGRGQRQALDKGEFDAIIKPIGNVFYACQNLDAAVEGYKTDYQPFVDERTKVVACSSDEVGGQARRLREGGHQGPRGDALAADAPGPIRAQGGAGPAQDAGRQGGEGARRQCRRCRVRAAPGEGQQKVVLVKAHPQAHRLAAEIKAIEDHLKAADALSKRSDGGSLKALTALKSLTVQCQEAQALAGKLAAAEKKLPALTKKITDGGVPRTRCSRPRGFALKLLVEENCSDDEAVKMAKDANGYADEGLPEQDVTDVVAGREVARGLAACRPTMRAAIGKNIRAGGTSSAEDAKAVAQAMNNISRKAIETLTADGITPSAAAAGHRCRARPGRRQAARLPETASLERGAGAYMGTEKKLIVGTRKDGGKREAPPKDAGPLPHAATDLFGHRGRPRLRCRRRRRQGRMLPSSPRAAPTSPPRSGRHVPGTDDYFLTKAEKGANDKGATSKTFAKLRDALRRQEPLDGARGVLEEESLGHLSSARD